MNFEEVYNEFIIYASKRHKKQGFDTLTQAFKNHVLPYFYGQNLTDLTVKDILEWQNNILKLNYKNNYNRNIYCSFNSFLNYCVLNSYIETNYLMLVGSFRKKVEYKEYNLYNYFEFKKFRKGLDHIVYKYLFDFFFFYGPRSSEALALKFSNLKGRYVFAGNSIQRGKGRKIEPPKTDKSNRYIKLGIFMFLKLFILKCYYSKKYGDEVYDYFIFGGKTPLAPTTVKRHKHKACIKQNIKEIKIHEFRHSCATRLVRLGVPMEKVSRLLGHSSISITMDIYVHNEKKRNDFHIPQFDFFNMLTQTFKKILQSIITLFV